MLAFKSKAIFYTFHHSLNGNFAKQRHIMYTSFINNNNHHQTGLVDSTAVPLMKRLTWKSTKWSCKVLKVYMCGGGSGGSPKVTLKYDFTRWVLFGEGSLMINYGHEE